MRETKNFTLRLDKDLSIRVQRFIDGIEFTSFDHIVNISLKSWVELHESFESTQLEIETNSIEGTPLKDIDDKSEN